MQIAFFRPNYAILFFEKKKRAETDLKLDSLLTKMNDIQYLIMLSMMML